MVTLIIILLLAPVIAYFAIQNTGDVSIYFLNYSIPRIPIYIVVVATLLIGVCISGIISMINNISTIFTLRGKESKIKDYKKENTELTKQVHQLELENTRLKTLTNELADDKSL